MTVKEKLLKEFEAAINAVFGDETDSEEYELNEADIEAVKEKVLFYMDLR